MSKWDIICEWDEWKFLLKFWFIFLTIDCFLIDNFLHKFIFFYSINRSKYSDQSWKMLRKWFYLPPLLLMQYIFYQLPLWVHQDTLYRSSYEDRECREFDWKRNRVWLGEKITITQICFCNFHLAVWVPNKYRHRNWHLPFCHIIRDSFGNMN